MIRSLVAAAVLSFFAVGSIAAENPAAAAVAVTEAEAVLELVSLDRATRVATFRGPTGATLAFTVPPEAQNLDRVKPGDLFKMRYVEALALALHKGGTATASDIQAVKLAPKGGTPGGTIVNTKEVAVLVKGIDRGSRTLAVQGLAGNPFALKVADEVRSFDEIAVGDTIRVTYTEAVALEMIPQPAK